jgi:hypothetical protein
MSASTFLSLQEQSHVNWISIFFSYRKNHIKLDVAGFFQSRKSHIEFDIDDFYQPMKKMPAF